MQFALHLIIETMSLTHFVSGGSTACCMGFTATLISLRFAKFEQRQIRALKQFERVSDLCEFELKYKYPHRATHLDMRAHKGGIFFGVTDVARLTLVK